MEVMVGGTKLNSSISLLTSSTLINTQNTVAWNAVIIEGWAKALPLYKSYITIHSQEKYKFVPVMMYMYM